MVMSDIYLEALRADTRSPIYKIEWMDKNENVTAEVTGDMLSGSINISYKNGMRRTAQLNLCNDQGSYIPDKDGLIWISKKFKLYTGLNIHGVEYFNAQGIFNLGNPILQGDRANRQAQVEAYDNFALLNVVRSYDVRPTWRG